MKETTRALIELAITGDETVGKLQRQRVLDALENSEERMMHPEARPMTVARLAQVLGASRTSLYAEAKRHGILLHRGCAGKLTPETVDQFLRIMRPARQTKKLR